MGRIRAIRSCRLPGAAALAASAFASGAAAAAAPGHNVLGHNVIVFVADGLRYGAVDASSAPQMQAIRREGVDFADSHALFPTLTTPNASAIATGHGLGDTGDFANVVYAGRPALTPAFLSLAPFLEDDAMLGAMNARFGGNYLGETSLLASARAAGFQTAAIGKLGPAAIQDVTARDGCATLLVDDLSGTPDGLPLCPDLAPALKRAGLDPTAPDRGLNTDPGNAIAPGVQVANVEQQDWFTRVAAEVVLPRFAAAKRPFVLVFWSRDPDGTQHNQGDSLNTLSPGINGATSRAAIRNADNDLGALRTALKRLGLEASTDIVVTADHGFATVSRASATSPAARADYPDVPHGFLPPGFLALDLGRALGLPVHEPTGLDLAPLNHPKHASAVLGADPARPEVVIGANGGSDALWLPHAGASPQARARLAGRIAAALSVQDYTAALFVADDLGPVPGALPMSAIGLKGQARTPAPDLIVSFRSGSVPGCGRGPDLCAFEVADTELQQGQGIHGGFDRATTRNMMAAIGPDFRTRFRDLAPVGNIDWAPTLAHILHLDVGGRGALDGRLMAEALREGGAPPPVKPLRLSSTPAANGFVTTLEGQVADGRVYGDVAGAPGRAVGQRP